MDFVVGKIYSYFYTIFMYIYKGSVYWMAPEVVKNEPYSAKVDIWSLGCTVIEMFTGQRPWLTLNQIATLYNVSKSLLLLLFI